MYDRSTIQGASFNMHGQLYCRQANPTALFSSLVVSALGSESDNLVSSPGRGKALCSWEVWGKKMQALLSGFAKSIYNLCHLHTFVNHMYVDISCNFISVVFCSVVRWSVHWAPSQMIQVLVLAGARRCAFEMCRKKKMQAALLGLAKPIYYVTCIHFVNNMYVDVSYNFISVVVDAEQSKYYQ